MPRPIAHPESAQCPELGCSRLVSQRPEDLARRGQATPEPFQPGGELEHHQHNGNPGGAKHPAGEPCAKGRSAAITPAPRLTSASMARRRPVRLHPEHDGRGRDVTAIRAGSWQIRRLMGLMVVSIVAACRGDGGTAATAGGADTTGAAERTTQLGRPAAGASGG